MFKNKTKKYNQYQNMLKYCQDPQNTVTEADLLSRNYVDQEESDQVATSMDGKFVTEFDFDCKKVLHLWLASVIPGPSYIGLHYNFSQRKIWGPRGDCLNKVSQCHVFLEERKMKLCTDLVLENNHEMYLKIKLDILIFKREYVEAAYEELLNKQKFWELKKEIEPILRRKNIYLMSILKKEEPDFETIMKDCSKDISREQIKNAMHEKQLKQKKEAEQLRQKNKKKYKPASSSQNQDGSCDQNQKEQTSNEQEKDLQQFHKLSRNKKESVKQPKVTEKSDQRIEQKPTAFKKQYVKSVLDVQKFESWIEQQKQLFIKEFIFNENRETVEVCLYTEKNVEKKINTINFYLHNSKFLLIQDHYKPSVEKIKKKVEEKEKNARPVIIKLIDGYVKEGTDQSTINTLFRDKKIKNQPTRNENKKVSFVHISGIKPNVDTYYELIANEIQSTIQKPVKKFEQKIVTDNFILSLGEVQDYLHSSKVKQLLKSIIVEACKKVKYVKLQTVLCPFSKFTTKISVPEHELKNCKQAIEKEVVGAIYCKQIGQFQNINADLLEKFIICRFVRNPSQAILISNKNDAITAIQEITRETSTSKIEQAQIFIKCNRVKLLKKFKDDLIADDSKPYTKNCKIILVSTENESKIEIFGTKKNVARIETEIIEYLSILDHEMLEKTMLLNDIEASVVEKNMSKFQNKLHQAGKFSFSFSKNLNIGCIISLGTSLTPSIDDSVVIYIHKQKTISCLPAGTIITFLTQEDFNFVEGKIFHEVKKNLCGKRQGEFKDYKRDYQYFVFENYKNITEAASYPFKKSIKTNRFMDASSLNCFAFFMPKKNKAEFVQQILNSFYKILAGSQIKIHIFEQSHQNIGENLKQINKIANKCLQKTQSKYYVIGEGKKMFYSEAGQKKIEKALEDGQKSVYLYNHDLNMTETTFLCSFKEEKLKHKISSKEMPVKILPHKVTFVLNEVQFEMPKSEIDKIEKGRDLNHWVGVSIGVYEIDLEKMIQTNLFSQYQRKVKKQNIKIESPYGKLILKMDYDFKVNEVSIEHKPNEEDKAQEACQLIRSSIEAEKFIKKCKGSSVIDVSKRARIEQLGRNYSIEINFDNERDITLKGFEKYLLEMCSKNIMEIIQQQDIKQCVYPEYWCPQKQDIETFVAQQTSQEFQQIQTAFSIAPIKQLIRIQNRLLYKKFYEEWQFLISLNGGPIREAKLYHGTNKTDPKCIYDDKEESFNINYTDDNNYLGKAIYFAQKSEYSYSYAYREELGLKSLFYCSVLVGDSQKFAIQTDQTKKMRDTSLKDTTKRLKYESSSLNTSRGQIYAVYKCRRAYPLYLIKF